MHKGRKESSIISFCDYLRREEKEETTIKKYERDTRKLLSFISENYKNTDEITKDMVLAYKKSLLENYAVSSVNSMLAAANHFLHYVSKDECMVKRIKVQHKPFLEEDKCLTVKDVEQLMEMATKQGKVRLKMIMETFYCTGIRVSELSFMTVRQVEAGIIKIHNKGKERMIAITQGLRKRLLWYAKVIGIKNGPIFVTRTGKTIDRSNLWRELKEICKEAGVKAKKCFPHNFRHLFARGYYAVTKDIVNLADILGHSSIETTKIYTKKTYIEFLMGLEAMECIAKE